ncbi:MAG: TetR/AcrR family transcriptional regulator [Acidimicrobiales bacterium]
MENEQLGATGKSHDGERVAVAAKVAERPLRADARRNQEKLVEAARVVFAEHGSEASMEAIAKQAGVGVGTLYRHFPKRVDVVEALYRSDVEVLLVAAEKALTETDPWAGLAGWLGAYVRYSLGKKTLLNELHEAFAKDPQLKLASRERIVNALGSVLERAQVSGCARKDVDAGDVMVLFGTMCMSATLTEPRAQRLLTMVLDGLRHQPPQSE